MNLTLTRSQTTIRSLEQPLAPAGIVSHRNDPANPNQQAMLQLTITDAGHLQQVVTALAHLARQPGGAL